jgi:hypothetical protein
MTQNVEFGEFRLDREELVPHHHDRSQGALRKATSKSERSLSGEGASKAMRSAYTRAMLTGPPVTQHRPLPGHHNVDSSDLNCFRILPYNLRARREHEASLAA